MTLHVEPFTIAVADDVLADLRARLRNVRLPPPAPGPLWEQGTDREFLERLLRDWADRFDWRARGGIEPLPSFSRLNGRRPDPLRA